MEKKQTIEKKRENFVEIFSKLFSIQILTHRNLEAFKKLEEKASNSKVFNNINENIFFSAEIPKQEFSPENQNKEIYLQDIVSSIEKQETIQIPFILVEFQDLQDVKQFLIFLKI